VEARITDRTKAVCVVHFAGYPAAVDRLAPLCERHGIALIEDVAHAPSATLQGRKLGTWGLAGAFSFFSNKILSVGEGGLLATDDDAVAECARRLRSQGMSSGSWARHTQQTDTYDAVGLGYNYRLDEPRSALLLSRLGRLEADIARRRELVRAYRTKLADVEGLVVPFSDASIEDSSCYVMPVLLAEVGRQVEVRAHMRDLHGIQTSLFYPAIHEFSAYVERFGEQTLERSEAAARCEITIPLYPHMTEHEQDRVVASLREALAQ
jgi:dTDP-4-amino-4,6-dideoxygalactose transaminase